VAKAGVVRFTACLAPLRDTMAVRANCLCPGLVDTPASRRSRARMTPAGRILLCRQGGEPPRLLPVADGQELAGQGGLDHAAEGDQPLLPAGRPDELERGGQAGRTAGDGQG
jgi:NAD(P)-dependent dehydrogenase (short-subunit alcohol dehydrogenase family)